MAGDGRATGGAPLTGSRHGACRPIAHRRADMDGGVCASAVFHSSCPDRQRCRESDRKAAKKSGGCARAELAERVGFEPTRGMVTPTRSPGVRLKPLGHRSRIDGRESARAIPVGTRPYHEPARNGKRGVRDAFHPSARPPSGAPSPGRPLPDDGKASRRQWKELFERNSSRRRNALSSFRLPHLHRRTGGPPFFPPGRTEKDMSALTTASSKRW